ncbi:MAG: MaoC family dehydratase N-terminal domain-containing protein [Actinomycetota bacterium]
MNPALEGKVYPAVRVTVTEDDVRRFAAAVGDDRPGVPLTFVARAEIAAGWGPIAGDADLGIDFTRVVHAEQDYRWMRPLEVGDVLAATTSIESIRERGGHGFLTMRTELRDAQDRTVVVARSTLLVRGGA